MPRRVLIVLSFAALGAIAWLVARAFAPDPRAPDPHEPSAQPRRSPSAAAEPRLDARISAVEPAPELAVACAVAPSQRVESTPQAALPAFLQPASARARVLRGRLIAPPELALPALMHIALIDVPSSGWESHLHRSQSPTRRFFDVAADGSFEIEWPAGAASRTVYADAPLLSDRALALLASSSDGDIAVTHVDDTGAEQSQVTLTADGLQWFEAGETEPDGRRVFEPRSAASVPTASADELVLRAQAAALIRGTLSDTPPQVAVARGLGNATVLVRAPGLPGVALDAIVWPGQAFEIQHVPFGRRVELAIEDPDFGLEQPIVLELAAGEQRDIGAIGERRYPLDGRVLDAFGRPVPYAHVHAGTRDASGRWLTLQEALAWEDGRFRLESLPWRPFSLVGSSRAPTGALHMASSSLIYDCTPSRALFENEFELRLPALAHVSGRVLRPDGSPASTPDVHVYGRASADTSTGARTSTERARAAESSEYVPSAADGSFAFLALPEHEYELWIVERAARGAAPLFARVTVRAPREELEIALAPLAPLRGRVELENGAAWRGAWTLTLDEDPRWSMSEPPRSFEDAEFSTYLTSLGPNRLHARTTDGLEAWLDVDVPADLAREHVLVLRARGAPR